MTIRTHLLAALETDLPHSARMHIMAAIDELNDLVTASAALVQAIPVAIAAAVSASEASLEPVIAQLKTNLAQAQAAVTPVEPIAGEPQQGA